MKINLAPVWKVKLWNYSYNSREAIRFSFLAGLSTGICGVIASRSVYNCIKNKQ